MVKRKQSTTADRNEHNGSYLEERHPTQLSLLLYSLVSLREETMDLYSCYQCQEKGECQAKPESSVHSFDDSEVEKIRSDLLSWYGENKRDLPWRRNASITDDNQRAYAIWVSEIMLQQTQVATVIDYYNKWIKKWPTLESLASATLEEVNEMWAGLGYYSRGRRLYEGAKKVVEQLDGQMPDTAASLLKELPGVGKYTAGAIASIAYNENTGLVDGNVIRVLCRLRMIGADSTTQKVTDTLWSHANKLVDPDQPGDFNQGVMELGATVCTPKTPDCKNCPLRDHCKAYAQVEEQRRLNADKITVKSEANNNIIDIECLADGCGLCIPDTDAYDSSLGVMNYPRKGKKKAAREESSMVVVLCKKCDADMQYLIVQRPQTGLLAGMWEFPTITAEKEDVEPPTYKDVLKKYNVDFSSTPKHVEVGEVVHLFSHIYATYKVRGIQADQSVIEYQQPGETNSRWVTREQFLEAAVSTAMKKVFKAYEAAVQGKSPKEGKMTKIKPKEVKGQTSIQSFFKPKSK